LFKPLGTAWLFDTDQGQLSVEVRARLVADDNLTLRAAAIAGNGIAMLPRYVADDAIGAGHLVEVLPQHPVPRSWFRAHVTQHRAHVARVARLLEWLTVTLQNALPRQGGTVSSRP
jgi:DNA-binding transcriptional LysR family regulator